MTVLDLSGYDALLGTSSSWGWSHEAGVPIVIVGVVGLLLVFFDDYRETISMGVFGMLGIMVFGVVLILSNPKIPAFSDYVNEAYGFSSSSLPDRKPEDGSLPITWKKDGEIHSGTLNLLDNEVSIKETDGGYLEVQQ